MNRTPSDRTGDYRQQISNRIEPLEHRIAPAVTIAMTDGVTSVTPGSAVLYTISYGNDGSTTASDVEISDTLPPGMTFNVASNPGWELTGNIVSLSLGDLPGGTNGTTQLFLSVAPVVPAAVDVIVNTATIRQAGPTVITASATDTDAVNAAPDLQVTKSDNRTSAAANDVLTYNISYSNVGNQNATGVFLTETVPDGTTFNPAGSTAGWTETTTGSGVYQLTIGPLAGGFPARSANFSVTVGATPEVGQTTVVNTISIADDNSNGADPTPANNTATDSNALGAGGAPDLVLTKTDGATTTSRGSILNYMLGFSNAGTQAAAGVVISDTLPIGTTFDSTMNPGWTLAGNALTFSVGTLNAGASGTASLMLQVSEILPPGVTSIANTANIADNGAGGADPTPANNFATDTDAIVSAVNLALTKTDGVTTVSPGETLTYTFDYQNIGDVSASGVVITDTMPAGIVFNPVGNPGWVASGTMLSFAIGTVAAGANGTATLVLNVSPSAGAGLNNIVNTASITDDGLNGSDSSLADNTATDSDALNAAPDLTLTKTDGVTQVSRGSTVTYTFAYANAGNQAAVGVQISDELPNGTTFDPVLNPSWTQTGGTVTFNVGNLLPGGSGTAALTLGVNSELPAGVTSIDNSATVADDGANGADPTPLNNTAMDIDAVIGIETRDLTLVKGDVASSTTPGSTLTYTLAYSNVGNIAAAGVLITDTLPPGTTFDPGQNPGWTLNGMTLTFPVGALAAGGSGLATLVLTVATSTPAGLESIFNTATISDDGTGGSDPTPLDNTATDTDLLVAAPELALTKSDGVTSAAPGGTLTYTLSYTNAGNQNSSGVVITDTLPAGTSFDPTSNAGWTLNGSTLTFNVGNVATGSSGTATLVLTVNASIPAEQTSVSNTATIADDGTSGSDTNPGNNTATDVDTLGGPGGPTDLAISKTAAPYAATRNGVLTYSLAYSNLGTQAATGVFLTETLPANMTFVAGGSTAGWIETTPGSGVYRFDVGSLAGAASGTATFQVRVASTLPENLFQFSNTATVADDASNGADPNAANNSATLSTPVYKGIYVAALGRSDSNKLTVANAGSQVKVYDAATGAVRLDFMAYEADAKRGVHVAVGDFNADGFDDIVTSYGNGGGRVRVFDGLTGTRLSIGGLTELNPFSGGENFGAFVAAGDVTGDGRADIVVSEAGHGNRVIVYNGVSGQTVTTFRPFGQVASGVRVSVGDTNGDGRADVITSHRTGSGEVKVFSGTSLPSGYGRDPLLNFETGIAGGVFVGAGNVTGDTRAEILIGGGEGSTGSVDVHAGSSGTRLRTTNVYGTAPEFGVRVAAVDVNFDGIAEIIAGPGLGGNGELRFVNGRNGEELKEFRVRPFQTFSQLAVRVAGTTTIPAAVSATT